MLARGEQRLAAIIVADIEQYSRLMHEDERATVHALRNMRDDVIKPTLENYAGNILKNTGDGFIAEFSTISGAVECAIELQAGFFKKNLDTPESRQLKFRMGINLLPPFVS